MGHRAALSKNQVLLGVRRLNLKVLSGFGTIVTCTGTSGLTLAVRALNSLQNAIMLMPKGPSVWPIEGDGFAFAAGTIKRNRPKLLIVDVHSEIPAIIST